MKPRLPNLTISADVSAPEFILRVEALSLPGWRMRRHCGWNDARSEFILDVFSPAASPHDGLFGQLVSVGGKKIAEAEIRADRWNGAQPPSYETYAETAKRFFKPLLVAYRGKHGRCTFRVQPSESTKPTLPKRAAYFFSQFVSAANHQALHSLDWQRFYHFIHVANIDHIGLTASDLTELLVDQGFPTDVARELARIYEHGRALLKNRIRPIYFFPPPKNG